MDDHRPDQVIAIDAGLECAPATEIETAISISEQELRQALALTVPAADRSAARDLMKGVLVRPLATNVVEFVASDGATMVTYTASRSVNVRAHWPTDNQGTAYSICIYAADLKRLITKLDKESDASAWILLDHCGASIMARRIPGNPAQPVGLMVGNYPDYAPVIREAVAHKSGGKKYGSVGLSVSASSLLSAMQSARTTSNKAAMYVTRNRAAIVSHGKRDRDETSTISAVDVTAGGDMAISLDLDRLISQVKAINAISPDKTITLDINANGSPMILTVGLISEYRALIMPDFGSPEEYGKMLDLVELKHGQKPPRRGPSTISL